MDQRTEDKPKVVSKNRARAGVTGHNVRYVLLLGTVGVAVIFAALWFFHFG